MTQNPPAPRRRHRRWGLSGEPDPMHRMRDDLDRVFSQYLRPFNLPVFREAGLGRDASMATSMDVSETGQHLQIRLDAPGVAEEDIDISLTEGGLTITGHREAEDETEADNYHRMERSFGAFHRYIALPCEVAADKVDAKLDKGVLTITLPKSQRAKDNTRKIKVKSA